MFNWLKKTGQWIKKKWKQTLVALGLTVAVALAWDYATPPEMITSIDFNGQTINFVYTDDNTNEDFVIATDQQTYGGWDKVNFYMAVYNRSGKDKDVNLQVHFKGSENLVHFAELLVDVPSTSEVADYGFKEYPCKNKWATSTANGNNGTILYSCNGVKDKSCNRIDKDNNCEIDNDLLGYHTETLYIDSWQALPTTVASNISSIIGTTGKQIPTDFKAKKQSSYFIKNGETKFFKVRISFQPKQQGEFWITANSDEKAGLLDPWYSASYSYRKVLTIESGYSTGVATTTNTGFVIVASTTQTFLKDTGQAGGRIAQMSGYDIIFVDDDDTTLLPFEYEKYSSSTGSLVAFVKVPDISSTTDKTIYMYYGNASATNNATSGLTWATGTGTSTDALGVWHMQYSTSTSATQKMMDSTNYGSNGTLTLTDATGQKPGKLDGSFQFDGVNDYVRVVDNSVLDITTAMTVSAWIKFSGTIDTNNRRIVSKGESGTNYGFLLMIKQSSQDIRFGDAAGFWGTSGLTLGDNNWHYIVGVHNGGNSNTSLRIYVDGVLKSGSITGTFDGFSATTEPLTIGAYSNDGALGSYFPNGGLIDDVRIYNYALKAEDILTMYNMGNNNSAFLTWGDEETPPVAGGGGEEGGAEIIYFD